MQGQVVVDEAASVVEHAGKAADAVVDAVADTLGDVGEAVAAQAGEAKDGVVEQVAAIAEEVHSETGPAHGHEDVADDDEALRALLDRPPPKVGWLQYVPHCFTIRIMQGFEDPIAKIPLHPEPAPSLHLPGEQEDAQHPYALPDHLDREATEAAAHAPKHPGDMGDPAKPSFAAVAAKKV